MPYASWKAVQARYIEIPLNMSYGKRKLYFSVFIADRQINCFLVFNTGFTYECCYCSSTPSLDFKGAILHVIDTHPDKEIKIRRIEGKAKTIIDYRVCAELCREQGRTITIDEENRRVHISKRDVAPKDSPLKKIVKTKNLGQKYFCSSDICSLFSEEDVSEDTGTLTELVEILPSVIESLNDVEN